MAREPQVTRTVKFTQAIILCVDVETKETSEEVIRLPRTYKNDEAILKAANLYYDGNKKLVAVSSTTVLEQLYCMSEADFIKYASPMEARKSTITENEATE